PLSDPDTMANTPWFAGTVYFPRGTYLLKSPITMSEAFGAGFSIHFVGEGLASTIQADDTLHEFMFQRKNLPFGIIGGNSTFSKLRFVGSACIEWQCNSAFAVRDCEFNCGRGVWYSGPPGEVGAEIYGTVDSCQFNGGYSGGSALGPNATIALF